MKKSYIWIKPKKILKDKFAQILINRGIKDYQSFIKENKNKLHPSEMLFGIKEASSVIQKAIEENKKIFIHGDFDVDGVTATSILFRFLYFDLKANVVPYIPSRFDEGYGLSEESINKIITSGGQLIITVDCGIKDINLISQFADKIDFIITDHHSLVPKEDFEKYKDAKIIGDFLVSNKAKANVHPQLKHFNSHYPFTNICAAMVSFKLCIQINEDLKLDIDLFKYSPLVALGTVCDVMPLVDENRTIVTLGLQEFKKTAISGIDELLKISGIEKDKIDSSALGFALGPRINASGRMDNALKAVKLLSTNQKSVAETIAKELDLLNKKRQELTTKYYEEALSQITADKNFIFIVGDDWPEGILGLIAGKLTNTFNKPSFVASKKGNIIKGSARGIDGINVTKLLKTNANKLVKFGGHELAAGFTLESRFKDDLIQNLNLIFDNEDKNLFIPKIKIDATLNLENINIDFIKKIQALEPFGNSNPIPVFKLKNLVVEDMQILGQKNNHIKLITKKADIQIEVLKFNAEKYFFTDIKIQKMYDMVGNFEINTWMGRNKLTFKLIDYKKKTL